jgi:hypothetical protein
VPSISPLGVARAPSSSASARQHMSQLTMAPSDVTSGSLRICTVPCQTSQDERGCPLYPTIQRPLCRRRVAGPSRRAWRPLLHRPRDGGQYCERYGSLLWVRRNCPCFCCIQTVLTHRDWRSNDPGFRNTYGPE